MRLAPLLPVVALAAGACSLTRPEEQPAYVKATAVESRVDRIEHQNEALLDLQRQVEALQAEVRRLRGELEETAHEAKSARDQQRDLYADADRRLGALEARASAAPAAAPAAAAASDRDAYQAALERLKGKDYAGAEKALADFLAGYPQSPLVDNAKYWLGETYYVEKRYADAVAAFNRVVQEHPDSRKVPDALLKLGYSQYELKRYREAREALSRVVQKYGDSAAATEARERLKRMDAEHH
ncbi:MAG TPA: tol-pal system protein YbgF [Steroidobacteraceae bacterium]|nr:tol-pal system protein YbgF [Steroidobacteraceae bacterium]